MRIKRPSREGVDPPETKGRGAASSVNPGSGRGQERGQGHINPKHKATRQRKLSGSSSPTRKRVHGADFGWRWGDHSYEWLGGM